MRAVQVEHELEAVREQVRGYPLVHGARVELRGQVSRGEHSHTGIVRVNSSVFHYSNSKFDCTGDKQPDLLASISGISRNTRGRAASGSRHGRLMTLPGGTPADGRGGRGAHGITLT